MSHLCRIVKKEKIPLWKRILIRLFGRYPAFRTDPCGYGILEYFYSYCPKHGYYIDYPHGYQEEIACPACEKIRLRKKLNA